jgi:dynamin 1-like protein
VCPPLPCTTPPRDLDNIGTTYLANKLSAHLINEITRKLPDIQNYVDKT